MRHSTWALACAFLLSFFLGSSLLSQTKAASGLDVNDLSVLFPLDQKQQPVPRILLQDPGQKSSIIASDVFGQLLQKAKRIGIKAPLNASIDLLEHWVVVAYRYDPCAPAGHNPPGGPCAQELRLAAQSNTRFGPADTALHMIFELGSGLPQATDPVLNDLLQTKRKAEALSLNTTDGKPLGVHPLLAQAAIGTSFEVPRLYADFLRRHARPENLKKLTIMGLNQASPTDWIFLGGDIVAGQWVQGMIPNLPQSEAGFVRLNIQNSANAFNPKPLNAAVSMEGFFATQQPDPDLLGELHRAVHRIQNPGLSNRNTTDCLSCHSATSIQVNPNMQTPLFIEHLTAGVPAGVTAFPAPMVLQNHPLHWNLRAFGYFGITPSLSLRSVHETGRATALANQILGLGNSGPDCSLVAQDVMSCFVKTSIPFATGVADPEECFQRCVLRPKVDFD